MEFRHPMRKRYQCRLPGGCVLSCIILFSMFSSGCAAHTEQEVLCAELDGWLVESLRRQNYLSQTVRRHSPSDDYACGFALQSTADDRFYEFMILLVYLDPLMDEDRSISVFPQHFYSPRSPEYAPDSHNITERILSNLLIFRYYSRRGIVHHVVYAREPSSRLGFNPESRELALKIKSKLDRWQNE